MSNITWSSNHPFWGSVFGWYVCLGSSHTSKPVWCVWKPKDIQWFNQKIYQSLNLTWPKKYRGNTLRWCISSTNSEEKAEPLVFTFFVKFIEQTLIIYLDFGKQTRGYKSSALWQKKHIMFFEVNIKSGTSFLFPCFEGRDFSRFREEFN